MGTQGLQSGQRREDLVFIRFLAILLITNSHLDSLYPFPQLATGGAIGNSLFFMISGYGLALSNQVKKRPFSEWYGRRLKRVYPPVFAVTLFVFLFSEYGFTNWTLPDYLSAFIWPTRFWFIGAFLIFYVLFYLTMRLNSSPAYLVVMGILLVPYVYFYRSSVDLSHYTIEGPGYFKWIFYLQVMLFGGYLAAQDREIKNGSLIDFVLLCITVLLYLFCGLLFTQGYYSNYQFMMHLITFPLIYLIFFFARSAFISERILNNRICHLTISLVAGLSLEIYLLQYYVYSRGFIQSLIFPLNVAAFSFVLLSASLLLSRSLRFINR
jgi:peptidoglycan/LPS O-acetylase OafA/YrhL